MRETRLAIGKMLRVARESNKKVTESLYLDG